MKREIRRSLFQVCVTAGRWQTAVLSALFVVGVLLVPTPARSVPLIAWTDNSPNTGAEQFLSDTKFNKAVSWTQAAPSANVTLSAILSSNVGATTGSWYVTDRIGAGTTNANVIYSGTYNLGAAPLFQFDFNVLPRTVLGTGLNFAAGTYYLVLDGPPGVSGENADWIGDFQGITPTLASGFGVGSYFTTDVPDSFAPASVFAIAQDFFVFELSGQEGTAPEPVTVALLGLGLAGLGWSRRRK